MKARIAISLLAGLGLLSGAQSARAKEPSGAKLLTPFGESVSVGGGVVNFVGDAAKNLTDVGGYWDVRLAFGTRTPFGIEAAYIGAAQNVTAVGMSNAFLVRNGMEANARINIPLVLRSNHVLEPFVLGGVGFARYNLNFDGINRSVMQVENDNVLVLPVGAGVAWSFHNFMVDGRFTYRPTFDDDLLRTATNTSQGLENWSAGLLFGYEY